MAAATMATAAGAMVILYYALIRRLAAKGEMDEPDLSGDLSKSRRSGRKRVARRPAQAPATWFETLTTLSETVRFTYSETLAKWPIGDLAFGINYLMRRQDNVQVASVYAGGDSVLLETPQVVAELKNLLRLLTLCMLFSKKPFPVFLDSAGYSHQDVLLQKPKAGLLKPAFTIIRDQSTRCILLLIRGTHSIKDTLTAATGAVVPFHHSVVHDGGISNLVLGYAHCGMVAAARWIAKLSTPCLLNALNEYHEYTVKIVGHSLGGGTAALLTYILREQKEFSSISCVTFAPAACMTWDLAESGKHFITTVINGSDLVPTFSTSSIDSLRFEVTTSSWLNDLRDQVEHTRVLNVVYRSATALGSRLPSIATAKARVAGASALLRPVSSGTQVVMKGAQNVAQAVVRSRSSISSWSCMGARRRTVSLQLKDQVVDTQNNISERSEDIKLNSPNAKPECNCSSSGSGHEDTDEDEPLISADRVNSNSVIEDVTEGELWYELEKELQRHDHEREHDEIDYEAAEEEEAEIAKEITEEEKVLVESTDSKTEISSPDSENHCFYPPGRIMHMVSMPCSETESEERVCLYQTPRELYSKIRLSKTMINDHYMPMYKKVIETLIRNLEDGNDAASIALQV